MCIKALPERLQTPEAWKGTDMDNWFQRWILKNPRIHGLLAYGPRDPHWWEKWRYLPISIIKLFGEGVPRYEQELSDWGVSGTYLSRVQYWTRWHFAIHWPFLITFHYYFHKKDVIPYPLQGWQVNTTNKLFYIYFGAHRDGDVVYWFPSAFIGLTWK